MIMTSMILQRHEIRAKGRQDERLVGSFSGFGRGIEMVCFHGVDKIPYSHIKLKKGVVPIDMWVVGMPKKETLSKPGDVKFV